MEFKIEFTKAAADISAVHDALYEYNLTKTGNERVEVQAKISETTCALVVRGSDDAVYGGVVWDYKQDSADTVFVNYMYLSEVLRGTGKGRELFEAMEKRVKSGGIKYVTVTTNTFQAPWFYTALGYKETGAKAAPLPNVPDNMHYSYCKEL